MLKNILSSLILTIFIVVINALFNNITHFWSFTFITLICSFIGFTVGEFIFNKFKQRTAE